jgi:anaerobic ribonucleoside-triphosphate reductase
MDGWEVKVQLAREHFHVRSEFRRFTQLRGSEREELVEIAINNLLKYLSIVLQVEAFSNWQRSFSVGRMLAHNEYVVHGDTDATFIDGKDKLLHTTEVKTSSSFPHGITLPEGCVAQKPNKHYQN